MDASLKSHFGSQYEEQLKSMTGWDMATKEWLKPIGTNALTDKIMQVSLSLIPRITAIRAFWEGIDECPVDQATKDGVKRRIEPMVTNLKEHTAWDVIFEVAIGGNPFPVNPDALILALEKMAFGFHQSDGVTPDTAS